MGQIYIGRWASFTSVATRYASVMRTRSDDIRDNLGSLESAWKWLGESAASAWDRMLNIGRETTVKDKIRAIQEQLVQFQLDPASKVNYFRATGKTGLDLQQELERLQAQDFSSSFKTAQENAARAEASRKKRQFEADQALKRQYENAAEKHQRTLAQIEQSAASKAMKEEAIRRENARYAQESKKGPQYRPPAGDRAQETAQSELLALQAQLQVLRQHTDVNDVISQQRKRLWTEQGKFAVLEEAATRRQLTGQEKSLLASKAQVLAQKEQLATVGDEVALQERLNRLHDQAEKFSRQQQAKRAEMASLASGETSRDAERQTTRNRISSEYVANPMAQRRALKTLEDSYARQDELERNWRAGALHGMNEYRQEAENTYGGIANVAQSALGGISDMMTSLVTTGTASFRAFSASILKMIIEVINKLLVAYAVQSSMGWISGSLSRPSVGNNPGLVPMGLHYEGGYTGEGGKYEPKGIVHGGEFVFTKEATRNIGIGNLYAMMRQAQGYANGGYVGNTAPMYGLRGASDVGAINVYTPVTLQMDKGRQDDKNTSASTQAVGKQLELTVKAIILDTFKRESSSGGKIHTLVKSMR